MAPNRMTGGAKIGDLESRYEIAVPFDLFLYLRKGERA
jgi:hypothetical protein